MMKNPVSYEERNNLDESKALHYFCNMKYNSAAPDAFAEVMRVMNHTELSSTDTLRVLLDRFAEVVKITNHTGL